MKWEIEFHVPTTHHVTVSADTEDEAVTKAWKRFTAEEPIPEWDVNWVTDLPEVTEEDDEVETDVALDGSTASFSPDRVYRYSLTRRWDSDLPRIAWVMLNPSTADAFKLDPTVRRCINFSKQWGFGSLVVLNAYALRSTDPKGLWEVEDPVGFANDACLGTTKAGAPRHPLYVKGDTPLRPWG